MDGWKTCRYLPISAAATFLLYSHLSLPPSLPPSLLPSFRPQGTFDGYESFLKDNKALRDTHTFRFGAIDGSLLDTAGVEKVS